MDEITQLGVACMFGAATKDEIESWIRNAAASADEIDPEIFEIYSKDVVASQSKFEAHFRKLRPNFRIDSQEGVQACKAVLKKQIDRLHSEEVTPKSFCQFICSLETYYMDNGEKTNGMVPYPDFIGDLWNACDWCDESWTLNNSRYLREQSAFVAEALAQA